MITLVNKSLSTNYLAAFKDNRDIANEQLLKAGIPEADANLLLSGDIYFSTADPKYQIKLVVALNHRYYNGFDEHVVIGMENMNSDGSKRRTGIIRDFRYRYDNNLKYAMIYYVLENHGKQTANAFQTFLKDLEIFESIEDTPLFEFDDRKIVSATKYFFQKYDLRDTINSKVRMFSLVKEFVDQWLPADLKEKFWPSQETLEVVKQMKSVANVDTNYMPLNGIITHDMLIQVAKVCDPQTGAVAVMLFHGLTFKYYSWNGDQVPEMNLVKKADLKTLDGKYFLMEDFRKPGMLIQIERSDYDILKRASKQESRTFENRNGEITASLCDTDKILRPIDRPAGKIYFSKVRLSTMAGMFADVAEQKYKNIHGKVTSRSLTASGQLSDFQKRIASGKSEIEAVRETLKKFGLIVSNNGVYRFRQRFSHYIK